MREVDMTDHELHMYLARRGAWPHSTEGFGPNFIWRDPKTKEIIAIILWDEDKFRRKIVIPA